MSRTYKNRFRPPFAWQLEERLAPATFTVMNPADTGPGSLRLAIQNANATVGADTVNFTAGVFGVPTTIMLTSGALTITDGVLIDASAVAPVTVAPNGTSQVFIVNGFAATPITVTFDNLVVTTGLATGNGGGINVAADHLILNRSVVRDNVALVYGGGIYVAPNGRLTVQSSTISGNRGNTAGGGAYLYDASLLVTDSTIQDNLSANGAGMALARTLGQAALWTISNSTISGNISPAGGPGGGIIAYFDTGVLSITNSTITNNKATPGGGIYAFPNPTTGSPTVYLESTIVGNNLGGAGGGAPDISAPFVQAKSSWIESPIGIGLFNNLGGNVPFGIAVGPWLMPLANYGGPTQTHALLPGSPAADSGTNTGLLLYDQRGIGFPRTAGAGTDMGAFEYAAAPPKVTFVNVNAGAAQRSQVTTIDVGFDQAVTFPAAVTAAFNLFRQSDGLGVTMNAVVGGPPTAPIVTLSFTGGPINGTSLADGRYTLTVLANQVTNGAGQQLDGNGDGIGGDNFVLVGTPANTLFRLFGDSDGDGDVDTTDYAQFRIAFGTTNPVFDFDQDGDVDTSDFSQFRQRFGVLI